MNIEAHVGGRLNILNGVGELQEGESVRDVYGLLCCIAGGFIAYSTHKSNLLRPIQISSAFLRFLSERTSLKFICISLSGEGAVLALLSGSGLI